MVIDQNGPCTGGAGVIPSWVAGVVGISGDLGCRGSAGGGVEGDHVLPSLVEDDVDSVPISANDLAVVVQPGRSAPWSSSTLTCSTRLPRDSFLPSAPCSGHSELGLQR